MMFIHLHTFTPERHLVLIAINQIKAIGKHKDGSYVNLGGELEYIVIEQPSEILEKINETHNQKTT